MAPETYSPLLTDFYQLTMAYGYWQLNKHEERAVFHLLFRKNPFKSNYALCCGLGSVLDFLQNWHFHEDDIAYLNSLEQNGKPIFSQKFLDYLKNLTFNCDVDAIPEGTVVFPHEPLLRIEGPLLQCQLIETALLNLVNFQTLIATKATRVCRAAGHDNVIEFGMRRAQGPDGALSASRAAYVGGVQATSNTLAGKRYDIPVRGTHAHSWVSAFDDERTAFAAYADVMPDNCVLLVDTYHTLAGVQNAIEIGNQLKAEGHTLKAIRLDSGDLAKLSIAARKLLDDAGLTDCKILASNSLDEYAIEHLKQQGAQIDIWGVGTNLATAYDQPALDGVYKLSALRGESDWEYKLKLSEQSIKVSNPGRHQVRRFFCNEQYIMDVIYDLTLGISDTPEAVILNDGGVTKRLDDIDGFVDLLEPVMRNGHLIHPYPNLHDIRKRAKLAVKQFIDQQGENDYLVGIENGLHTLKLDLMKKYGKQN